MQNVYLGGFSEHFADQPRYRSTRPGDATDLRIKNESQREATELTLCEISRWYDLSRITVHV